MYTVLPGTLQWSEQFLQALRAGNHEDALSCGKKALNLQPGNSSVKEAVALLEQLLDPGKRPSLLVYFLMSGLRECELWNVGAGADGSSSESGSDEDTDDAREDAEAQSDTSESSSSDSSQESELCEKSKQSVEEATATVVCVSSGHATARVSQDISDSFQCP